MAAAQHRPQRQGAMRMETQSVGSSTARESACAMAKRGNRNGDACCGEVRPMRLIAIGSWPRKGEKATPLRCVLVIV